jgi:Fe2+ or Zn2+ uptake regulation protein
VRDVTVEFAGLELPADAEQGFAVGHAEVVFRGRCAECAADAVPSITPEP